MSVRRALRSDKEREIYARWRDALAAVAYNGDPHKTKRRTARRERRLARAEIRRQT